MLVPAAGGIAGLPIGIEEQLQELEGVIQGDGRHRIRGWTGSEQTEEGFEPEVGVGALGHASALTQGDALGNNDWAFYLQPVTGEGDRRTTGATEVIQALVRRYAYAIVANFAIPGAGDEAVCAVWRIYADFDIGRAVELALGLPNTMDAANMMHDPIARQRIPGYTVLAISGAMARGFRAPGQLAENRGRAVRRRLNTDGTYITPPRAGNRNGEGGADQGQDAGDAARQAREAAERAAATAANPIPGMEP
jgi:hypothetical protein